MNFRVIYVLLFFLAFLACEDENPRPSCDGSLAVSVASTVDASCGQDNGSIVVSSTGGTGSIMYQVGSGAAQTGTTISDLGQGAMTVVATDENGCKAEAAAEIKTGVVLADIRPIINASCAVSNCHNGDNGNLPNFSMDNVLISSAGGIKTRTGNETMPPAGRDDLTAEQIQLIACWVDDGAPQ